jgi:hypothetical protein
VPRIGVVGKAPACAAGVELVIRGIQDALAELPVSELVGVTCLGPEFDLGLVRGILAVRGILVAVAPSWDYGQRIVDPDERATFESVLEQAAAVHVMPFPTVTPETCYAARHHLVKMVHGLVIVCEDDSPEIRPELAELAAVAGSRQLPVTVARPQPSVVDRDLAL